MITVEHHHGAYILRHGKRDKEGELIQTDWDYPYAAGKLGWSTRRVRKLAGKTRFMTRASFSGSACSHPATDGTVDCLACEITASEFIQAAGEFLDSKC